jgi:hypothetical protein
MKPKARRARMCGGGARAGRACTCRGARLRDSARESTGTRARVCRWRGHGGGPGRQRAARRLKAPRDGTQLHARAAGTTTAPARIRFPAWHEGPHHQRRRRGGAVRMTRSLSARRRGIHRGAGKLVLTLVATGRRAGVGEEGWRVLSGVGEDDGGAVARK